MYRRRRPQREKIFFSFDSFLDVVANVIGIIIRLILVAWVGARSYSAAMQLVTEEPAPLVDMAPLPPPRLTDDPLHTELALAQREMEEHRQRLLAKLQNLEGARAKSQLTKEELDKLARKNQEMERQQKEIEKELQAKGQQVHLASLSLEGLRARGRALAEQIKSVEALPPTRKELRYHTPVSRLVRGEEIFFECRGGKVTFIDLSAFLHEIKSNIDDAAEPLRKEYKLTRTTPAVGAFRMRYFIERERGLLESSGGFRYGVSGWVIEPITPQRGETQTEALAATSDFRRSADAIDPSQAVVTFWVYPDSFELFRALRDYLYERDVEVAGRPLPLDAPIAASRHGTKSRGQ